MNFSAQPGQLYSYKTMDLLMSEILSLLDEKKLNFVGLKNVLILYSLLVLMSIQGTEDVVVR